MQSYPIKFKCGHEKALPLDERGKELEDKIADLSLSMCPNCAMILLAGPNGKRFKKKRKANER